MKPIITISSGIAALSLLAAGYAAPPAPATQAGAATPAPNWYNVEVIVFRNLDPKAGALETWPADPGEPDWKSAVALNPPDSVGQPVPYQDLSPVNEQLGEDWNRLKRSHAYQPLLHVTWTQPATDRAVAPAVRIGVPPYAVPTAVTAPAPAPVPAGAAGNGSNSVQTPPLVATPVYGLAKLSTTGNYLHFDLDLAFRGPPLSISLPVPATGSRPATTTPAATHPGATPAPPALTGPAAASAFQLYRLEQDRRIDAGKLCYFDHPLFGALVLVTPVRKP